MVRGFFLNDMHRLLIAVEFVLVCLGFPALANDTFVHESAGNLIFVQTKDVAIDRELLIIGPPIQSSDAVWKIPIHVEYDLQNTSAATVQAHIGFPLAACSLGDYLWAKHTDFVSGSAATCVKEPKMTLGVDGRRVTGRWDFIFLLDGAPLGTSSPVTNLGKRLRALIGLVRDPDEHFYKDDPEFLRAAKEVCTELGGEMKDADCSAFKRISVHRTFLWEHAFAPHAQSHVVHDYRVAASMNLHPADVFAFDAFCVADPSVHSAWAKYGAELHRDSDSSYFREFFTEYVLRTAALWAGPIKEFELVIRKSAPQQLVSTCFAGLTRASAVEFRAHRENYLPPEDLRILYLPEAR